MRSTPLSNNTFITENECLSLQSLIASSILQLHHFDRNDVVEVENEYVIEHLIEKTKVSYYECLQESSLNWHEGANNYVPFVQYMLGVVVVLFKFVL